MSSDNRELINLVHDLIEAENKRDMIKASSILAQNFTGITRSEGIEEDRDLLLNRIANANDSGIFREIDDHDLQVWTSGNLGVARSLVITRCIHIPNNSDIPFSNIPFTKKVGSHAESGSNTIDRVDINDMLSSTGPTTVQDTFLRFRNIHVFEKQEGQWRCVAWQVTELK